MSHAVTILTPNRLSAVRGVGRYTQLLTEALAEVETADLLINPFVNLIESPLLWRKKAARQIGVIHDLIPLKYPHQFPIGIRGLASVWLHKFFALRLYDRFVTDSQVSKQDIVRLLTIKEDLITVLYPPIKPFVQMEKPSAVTIPSQYLIYVGDVTWNKNLLAMAHAVQKAQIPILLVGKAVSRQPDPRDPWQKEFRAFSTYINGNPLFIRTGYVPDEELAWLYEHALANILVSRDEGFGYSYVEAASLKTPSLLADIPVLREVASDTALYVMGNDAVAIAVGIQRLSNDRSLRSALSLSAFKRSALFSLGEFTKQFVSLI